MAGLDRRDRAEHRDPDLRRFSVVAATYSDGRRIGAVGVIGPTRMPYSRAINAVDTPVESDQSHGFEERYLAVEDERQNPVEDPVDTEQETTERPAPPNVSATSSRTFCFARPPSSRTIASARTGSAQPSPKRRLPTSSRNSSASSTIWSALSRRNLEPKGPTRIRRGVELIHRQLIDIAAQARREADRSGRRRFRPALPPGGRLRTGGRPARGRSSRSSAAGICSATGCSAVDGQGREGLTA